MEEASSADGPAISSTKRRSPVIPSPLPKKPKPSPPATNLLPGARVWLCNFTDIPALNGDSCEVLWHAPPSQHVSVRRCCTGEVLSVLRSNLVGSAPDGVDACVSLLARALGRALAEKILSYATCQRCWRPCAPGGVCRVRHPIAQRVLVSSELPGYARYRCRVCWEMYHVYISGLGLSEEGEEALRKEGGKCCFEGQHSICAPRDVDCRRAVSPSVKLLEDRYLFGELCALPEYVTDLSIHRQPETMDGGMADPHAAEYQIPGLHLPLLKTFYSNVFNVDVEMNSVITPLLESVSIERGYFTGEPLPELKHLELVRTHVKYRMGPSYPVFFSLTKLESLHFDYDMDIKELHLASNELRRVFLNELNVLEKFSLWAPNLETLRLGGCPMLDSLSLLKEHDLKSCLPADHTVPALKAELDAILNMSEDIRGALQLHPNIEIIVVDS